MLFTVKTRIKTGLCGLLLAVAGAQSGLALADDLVAKGQAVFERDCSVCHTANAGGANIMGPNLHGVIGRNAGSLAGFSYSQAMKDKGAAWSRESLEAFVTQPQAAVPGTYMPYQGLADADERKALSLWLSQQH
ncbi:c-type cytochrome [Pseudomonas citronellolis]|uniref:c-type cytochrome n=1 Tax=Pseudomonas citronellolis TaxID=53408 RepID=UPI0020A155C3|nr:c-type cytochrome [Pseudomonas citronellolis]